MSATGEDPNALANYRFARGAAIILGVLIAIALVALVLGFALRSGSKGETAAVAAMAHPIALPPGAHIVSMDVIPGRLILRLRVRDSEEIDIVDTDNGRLVGQVRGSGAPPPRDER